MTDISTLFKKIQKQLGDTPQQRRELVGSALFAASGVVACIVAVLNPPPKRNPADFAIENYTCPADSRGPYQLTVYGPLGAGVAEDIPYCERGPWYWPKHVDAIRRDPS